MFYFDVLNNKKVLKSSVLNEFQDKFKHIFTTKESFIKTDEENSKNTAKLNRGLILDYLKIDNLIEIKQTHSTNIAIFDANSAKNPDILDKTDGVLLQKPNSATILNFADCTPVILYDPKNVAAAGLHAGWRGTAGEICKKAVDIMIKNFNSKPSDIIAAIGPCISQDAFETDFEVYEKLNKTIKNGEKFFVFKETENGRKAYPDLAKINAAQLIEKGVKIVDICHLKTTTDNEFFFSYRKNNKTTSRISVILKIE